jgi:uncharacterized protein (UPF0371 family)
MCDIIDFRAAEIDFYKEQGDDFVFDIEVTDEEDVEILIDDYTNVELEVDRVVVAELGDGITISGNVISVLKADDLAIGEYAYKVRTYDADNAKRTIIEAKLIIG